MLVKTNPLTQRLWGESSGPPKSPPGSLLGAKDNYSNETLMDCSFQGQYEFGDFDDLSGNDTLNSRKLAPEGARGKAPPGAPLPDCSFQDQYEFGEFVALPGNDILNHLTSISKHIPPHD